MSEQRKFPLVYQNVDGVNTNVYTGTRMSDFINLDALNNARACNRCDVDGCKWRGDTYNIDCEPGIDCLASK